MRPVCVGTSPKGGETMNSRGLYHLGQATKLAVNSFDHLAAAPLGSTEGAGFFKGAFRGGGTHLEVCDLEYKAEFL